MSGQIRGTLQPISDGVRAYFAPVNRTTEAPSVFDPAVTSIFDPPPSPWIDAGRVEKFARTAQTKVEVIRTGPAAAATRLVRTNRGAAVSLEFRDWGKLQMALACGAQHMNVLATAGNGAADGSGGAAQAAIALQAGSTAQELMAGAAVSGFSAGDLVAVDIDYQQQTGYIGTGIAGAYISTAQVAACGADYVRRITFNVGHVAVVTDHSLQLDAPLLGGTPLAAARVQKVVAFVDREGGSFFQEWSALFVMPANAGGQVCFYYPRLQSAISPSEDTIALAAPLRATTLRAAFEALPSQDANDGEWVSCYRIYFPPRAAAAYCG